MDDEIGGISDWKQGEARENLFSLSLSVFHGQAKVERGD
jgi:hypothetical protein